MLNKDKEHYSYSGIKRFIKEGPSSLITEKNYSNKGMNKGLILEDMLMLSDFDDHYYISEEDIGTLTSMERKLLDAKVKRPDKEYQYLREDLGFFTSDNDSKFKTRVEQIDKFYEGYKESIGKKFIKKDLWSNIFTMSNALKADDNISSYFNNNNISSIQNIYQKTIEFEYKGFKFKGILDIIQINNINKTVQAVDLKYTHASIQLFKNEFFKFRYDIQACLYSLALSQFIEDNNLDDYKIVEPAYIAVNDNLETCKFIIDTSILKNAWDGYNWNGYDIEGIKELCSTIKWHIDNEVFNMSKEYSKYEYVRLKGQFNGYSNLFADINNFKSPSEEKIISDYTNKLNANTVSGITRNGLTYYSSKPKSKRHIEADRAINEYIMKDLNDMASSYNRKSKGAQQMLDAQQQMVNKDLSEEKL